MSHLATLLTMMRRFLIAAALAVILGCSPDLSPTQTVYGPVERDLDGEIASTHSIELSEKSAYRVEVDQLDGDLALELRAPDGQLLAAVADPLGRGGSETLLIESTAAGAYQLSVRSILAHRPRQRYRFIVEELSNVTRDDQRRVAAEGAMTSGAQLNWQAETSSESAQVEALRARSIEQYQVAHSLWKRLRDAPNQARALHSAAALRYQLFEWELAAELADEAARLYEESDDGAGAAKALQLQAEALLETQEGKDFHRALVILNEVLERQRTLGSSYGEAVTINTLGLAHFLQGGLEPARRYFVAASGRFDELGEHQDVLLTLHNIAAVDSDAGNLPSAIENYEKALAVEGSPNSEFLPYVLEGLALAHSILGNLQEALIRYGEAVEAYDRVRDRSGKARALRGRAWTYGRLGDWETALRFLLQAQRLLEGPAEKQTVVQTHIDIGLAYRRLGQPEEALQTHMKALDLAKTPLQIATAHLEIGRDYLANNDVSASLDHFNQAFAAATTANSVKQRAFALQEQGQAKVLSKIDAPGGLLDLDNALKAFQAVRSEAGEAQTLHAMARAKHTLGMIDEANEHGERALEIIENLRIRVGSPSLRLSFTGVQLPTYETHIGLLMDLHDSRSTATASGANYLVKALEVSERARARSLIELLHEAQTDESQGIDSNLLREQEEKRNALTTLAYQIEVSADPEEIANIQKRIHDVRTDLDIIEERIYKQNQPYAELTQPPKLSASDMQRLLSEPDATDTILLEYSLGDERSFLWCVTQESIEGWTLPGRAEIESAALDVYDHFKTAGDRVVVERSAARLAELVLSPVIDRLEGRRIVVVPDGALQYIPFGALPVDSSGTRLLEQHEVVTLPSASTLAILRKSAAGRKPARKTIAIFADPVFDEHDIRLTAQVGNARHVATRGQANQVPRLQRLPGTGSEADAISRLARKDQVLKATGFAASRDAVLTSPLSDYRLLHFATHGLIDTNNPERSGLGLSAFDRHGNPQSGFLWLHDIYALKLNAELVILSACEAHLGKEIRGEGLIGLTRGFMYAGAPRVIASLWLAPDQATASLMEEFYRLVLKEDLRPADALRLAQLSTAKTPGWRHPFYWAGFTLQGDWR